MPSLLSMPNQPPPLCTAHKYFNKLLIKWFRTAGSTDLLMALCWDWNLTKQQGMANYLSKRWVLGEARLLWRGSSSGAALLLY